MDKTIFGEILDIETNFQQIQNHLTILKDAVENNDETLYLLDYVQFINEQMDKYFEQLDEHNRKIGQIIIHSLEQQEI